MLILYCSLIYVLIAYFYFLTFINFLLEGYRHQISENSKTSPPALNAGMVNEISCLNVN